MSDPPSRNATIVNVADDVIGAFKSAPILLLIVLLNMAFAGAASYFMVQLETLRHEASKMILDRCLPPTPRP